MRNPCQPNKLKLKGRRNTDSDLETRANQTRFAILTKGPPPMRALVRVRMTGFIRVFPFPYRFYSVYDKRPGSRRNDQDRN